eukprot:CAMPEP_0119014540 /NCGR_PEP_ID=MMETSP1176-20130426/9912_1 /TAXON_ID=265551 /ORGANISM="Synedropsis recta cf, Strain CCMP1620" /LENGTH=309 /DNA_ID=CAMNT_0006967731 /DNA_START=77 /DNA_END=1006 /DNA_ORIENTATION=+
MPPSTLQQDEDPVCCRARRDLNDPFFLKGYHLAWRGDDGAGVAIYYVQDQHGNANAINKTSNLTKHPTETTASGDDDQPHHYQPPCYPCGILGCAQTFTSLAACEGHYEESHMFQCRECHAILPSDHLLDLHLQEAHDNAYFLESVKRGTQGYQCLVCHLQFPSMQERLTHLMVQHGYPKWFRFIPQAQPVDEEIQKKKDKWIKNHEHHQSSKETENYEDEKDAMNDADTNEELLRLQKHDQRRDRQKQKRAKVPCKFYNQGGCWRGDKCMFLHSNASADVLMEDLTQDLANKVKVTVPDQISFGRKRR